MVEESYVFAIGMRLAVKVGDEEAGHAFLYFLKNDLHEQRFALLEDLHVEERFRGRKLAHELMKDVIERSQREKCYKLIATSRNEPEKKWLHDWYVRLGLRKHGTEFRIDL